LSPSLLPFAEIGCPLKKDRQPSYFRNLKKKNIGYIEGFSLVAKTFSAAKMWAVTCTLGRLHYGPSWSVHLESACFGLAQGVHGFL
jgi:hypothetical protein